MKISEIITEGWSKKYKRSIDCSRPKGFSQRAHCQGRKKNNESVAEARSPEEFMRQMGKIVTTPQTFEVGDWVTIDPNETEGYASSGMTGVITKLYTDDEGESMAQVNIGGAGGVQTKMKTHGRVFGPPGTTLDLGKGIRSYGTATVVPTSLLQKHDPQGVAEDSMSLHDWFGKGKHGGAGGGGWDRYNTKGERIGKCGERSSDEGKPKCLSKSKAASLRASGGKKAIAAAVNKKRRNDSNPDRRGAAINVSSKKAK